eukprot:321751_1
MLRRYVPGALAAAASGKLLLPSGNVTENTNTGLDMAIMDSCATSSVSLNQARCAATKPAVKKPVVKVPAAAAAVDAPSAPALDASAGPVEIAANDLKHA